MKRKHRFKDIFKPIITIVAIVLSLIWMIRDEFTKGEVGWAANIFFLCVVLIVNFGMKHFRVVDVEFDDKNKLLILTKLYGFRKEKKVEIPYSQVFINAYYNPIRLFPYSSIKILHCESPGDIPRERYPIDEGNFNRFQLEKLLIRLLEVSANSEESKQDIRNALPQN